MKPFLKWAGNKFALIQTLKPILPTGNRLIEPFAGSCAVFLNTEYENNLLAEANLDLVNLYNLLKTEKQGFIDYCNSFFVASNNQEEIYYKLREQFNASQDAHLRAALFVYFNKHGYNGLCRYNSKGYFNVPFGRYKKPYFPLIEMQYFAHKAQQANFIQQDFVATMQSAKLGDIIYCDPPYVPLSPTAKFTQYSTKNFGIEQQQALAKQAELLVKRGIPVIISNHDTPLTRQLYVNAKITSLNVRRFISCKTQNRTKAPELIAIFG